MINSFNLSDRSLTIRFCVHFNKFSFKYTAQTYSDDTDWSENGIVVHESLPVYYYFLVIYVIRGCYLLHSYCRVTRGSISADSTSLEDGYLGQLMIQKYSSIFQNLLRVLLLYHLNRNYETSSWVIGNENHSCFL